MQSVFSSALSSLLSQHAGLSPSRRQTLAWLVLLILQHGSVCLWRLAAHVASRAELASVQRRFYRFFQFARLDGVASARIVVGLLGLENKPWVLAIDRTNWDFGRTTINILMVAVEWNGLGIPLIWTLLAKDGNSSTAERSALLDRLAQAFPNMTIAALTGDREFIPGSSPRSEAWMGDLARRNIPFVLRLRENQYVQRQGYAEMTLTAIARSLKPGQKIVLKQPCCLGRGCQAPPVRLVIVRLCADELLALATNSSPRHALARYRRRWRIEGLFANLKSKGFNLEDTHLTQSGKLATLLSLLAFAVALAAKAGAWAHSRTPIKVKKHGRRAQSLFAYGLAALCKLLASPDAARIAALLHQLLAPPAEPKSLKQCQV
jgi:hypothetical protein